MGNEAPVESPAGPKLDYDSYKDARASWESVSTDQTKFLDQTNLTLAGGALGLSLTFLHDFVTVPREGWALSVGGILLILGIVLTLASVQASQHAIERFIRDLDDAARRNFSPESLGFLDRRYVNSAARMTFWLNAVSSMVVVVGIALIGFFAYSNLDSVHWSAQPMQNTSSNGSGIIQRGAVPIAPAVARPPQQAPQAAQPQQGTKK